MLIYKLNEDYAFKEYTKSFKKTPTRFKINKVLYNYLLIFENKLIGISFFPEHDYYLIDRFNNYKDLKKRIENHIQFLRSNRDNPEIIKMFYFENPNFINSLYKDRLSNKTFLAFGYEHPKKESKVVNTYIILSALENIEKYYNEILPEVFLTFPCAKFRKLINYIIKNPNEDFSQLFISSETS